MLEIAEGESPFPHKEITEAIIGAAFEVYNHLGYGFLEKVYHRALQVELLRRKRMNGSQDDLTYALGSTINGIAAGLHNTG